MMRSAAILILVTAALTGAVADGLASIDCPSDDSKNVTTSVGSIFQVECATDHTGGNLPNSLVYVKSLAQCVESCSTTPDCVAVALSGTACYRKGAVGKRVSNTGVNGAVLLQLGPDAPATSSPGSFRACPAGNNTLYQSGTAIFQIQCGVDHAGGNLPNPLTYPGGGLKGCADRCAATPGCVDVSMSGTACYLKGSVGKQLLNSGINGALLVGSAPLSSSVSSSRSSMGSGSIITSSTTSIKSVSSLGASRISSLSSAKTSKPTDSSSKSSSTSGSTTMISVGRSSNVPSSSRLAPNSGTLSFSASTSRSSTPSRSVSSAVSSSSSSFICPASTVSSYSSALISNAGARYDCANGFPQFTYYATTTVIFAGSTIPFTTTSITCTPGSSSISSSTPVLPTRSSTSVASQGSQASRLGSSQGSSLTSTRLPGPQSTVYLSTPSRSSTLISSPSGLKLKPRTVGSSSTISAPPSSTSSSGVNPDVPFEGLPFPCVSSICSAIAGTITVTSYYTSYTVSGVVATVSVTAPEQCAAQDFCDTDHVAPVCRPEPITNGCVPGAFDGRGGFYTPPCTSSNGCDGYCYIAPEAVPKNSSVTGNYTTNPDGFFFGQCVDPYTDYFFSYADFNLPCKTSNDCGRGAVCVDHEFGPRCLVAASSTCNPGEGDSISSNGVSLLNKH